MKCLQCVWLMDKSTRKNSDAQQDDNPESGIQWTQWIQSPNTASLIAPWRLVRKYTIQLVLVSYRDDSLYKPYAHIFYSLID